MISTAGARQTFYATDSDDVLFFAIEPIGPSGPELIGLTIITPWASKRSMRSLGADQQRGATVVHSFGKAAPCFGGAVAVPQTI